MLKSKDKKNMYELSSYWSVGNETKSFMPLMPLFSIQFNNVVSCIDRTVADTIYC